MARHEGSTKAPNQFVSRGNGAEMMLLFSGPPGIFERVSFLKLDLLFCSPCIVVLLLQALTVCPALLCEHSKVECLDIGVESGTGCS
jgi:hypothetical protein